MPVADQLFMCINEDWAMDDSMDNIATTGWSIASGGAVTQGAGYVQIDASAGTDAIFKFSPEKVLPYTIETLVATTGANQAIRIDNGSQRVWINFPNTLGDIKYYRLIVRAYSTKPGDIALYENGKLIKDKADLVESTTFNSLYYYNSGGSTSGEVMYVYHHRHAWGVDWGAPQSDKMTTTIYLDGREGYTLLLNRNGAEMPPLELVEDEIPFESGSIWRQTNIQARTISLGLLIAGASKSDLNDKKRKLRAALGAGAVRLYAKMSDGYRYLTCRYSGGMEGEENKDTMGTTLQKYVVSFRAFFPFWQKAVKNSFVFTHPDALPTKKITVTNNSTASECYPEFYISGPGVNPKIENKTTGKSFQLNVNLATSSDYVYVNAKPGERVIRDKNGVISWNLLSTGLNQFWPLVPGDNDIMVNFTGGGVSPATSTTMLFREVHWGT